LFVLLLFGAVFLVDGVEEDGDQLLEGVSTEGDFDGVDLSSSVSEVVEVAVVDVGGEERIFGLVPGKVFSNSGVDGGDPASGEEVVGAGSGRVKGLHHGEDVAGLEDLVELDGKGVLELSKRLDGGVDERVDITVLFEPGGQSSLLPDGDIGESAVEEESVCGVTDFSVFGAVEGSRDEDGKDLLLNNLVGEDIVSLTVSGDQDLLLLGNVEGGAGLDEAGKGEDGLNLDQGVDLLIHDLLDDFDNFGVSEVSEGSQKGDDPVLVLFGVGLETLLELFDEVGDELLGDVLFVAELAVEGNGEAGVADLLVDAGLVNQVGESEHGGGAELLLTLDGVVFDESEEVFKDFLGGSAEVHGDGGEGLGSFFSVEVTALDELEEEVDGGVGSSDGEGIQEDGAGNFLLFASGLDVLAGEFFNFGGVEDAEGLDDRGDLGQDFAFGNGVAFGGLDEVTDDFFHEFLDALLHRVALQGGDEHLGQGGFVNGGLTEESLVLVLGGVSHFFGGRRRGRGGRRRLAVLSRLSTTGLFLGFGRRSVKGSLVKAAFLLGFLFLGIEDVDEVVDGLGILDLDGFTLGDGQKSDVLLGSSDDLFGVGKTGVDAFLLGDLQDGVVATAVSASQIAGNEGTAEKVSTSVVSGTELEFSGGGVGKDGLVDASGEVDGLDDFVDLVVVVAKLLEGTGPGLFFGAAGRAFRGRRRRGGSLSVVLLVTSRLVLTLLLVLGGFGGRRGRRSTTALFLEVNGEGGIEGSVLGDGVVSFTLSVDGFFDGFEEETSFLVLFFGTDSVGFAVQVSFDEDVLAGGVKGPDGSHGLLDVDSPGRQVALNLDGGDDTTGKLDFHGAGQVLLQFLGNSSFLAVLEDTTFPAEFHIFLDFESAEVFGLDVDGTISDGGDHLGVFELESSVLLSDFGDSSHHTATNLVSVLLSAFPSEISRNKAGQEAHANKASNGLHVEYLLETINQEEIEKHNLKRSSQREEN